MRAVYAALKSLAGSPAPPSSKPPRPRAKSPETSHETTTIRSPETRRAPPDAFRSPKKDPGPLGGFASSPEKRPPRPVLEAAPPPPLTEKVLAAHGAGDDEARFKAWRRTASRDDPEVADAEDDLATCKARRTELKAELRGAAAAARDARRFVDSIANELGSSGDASPAAAALIEARRRHAAARDAHARVASEAAHVDARRKYLFRLVVAKFQAADAHALRLQAAAAAGGSNDDWGG